MIVLLFMLAVRGERAPLIEANKSMIFSIGFKWFNLFLQSPKNQHECSINKILKPQYTRRPSRASTKPQRVAVCCFSILFFLFSSIAVPTRYTIFLVSVVFMCSAGIVDQCRVV